MLIPVKGAVLDGVILPHCLSELDCLCLVFLYTPKAADAKPVTCDENLARFLERLQSVKFIYSPMVRQNLVM